MFPQIAKSRFSWNFPPKGFRSDRVRVVSFERLFRKKSSTRNSLPETNSSHLRMDGWKTTFFLSGANCLFLWSVIDNCALRSWNSRIFGTTKRLCPIVHRGSKCGPSVVFSSVQTQETESSFQRRALRLKKWYLGGWIRCDLYELVALPDKLPPGGGNSNIFYVHPYLGKIPMLTNIFERGWNHQLDPCENGKSTTCR